MAVEWRPDPHCIMAYYNLMVQWGHSPNKAMQIALDASRGDRFAIEWICYAAEILEVSCPIMSSTLQPLETLKSSGL
jgi:hypothetical protein